MRTYHAYMLHERIVMNILLVSFGDHDYDGRLRELCKVFSDIGNLFVLCRSSYGVDNPNFIIYHGESYWGFIQFAIKQIKYFRRLNIQVIVFDNRKSVIPGSIIKKKCGIKYVIQDCRELYFAKDTKRITSKIGCLIEKPSIKKADLIICANIYRAKIMEKVYQLSNTPLVFENLRKLEYSNDVDMNELSVEFSNIINVDEFRVIATAGCDLHRLNDVLVKSLRQVKHRVRLIMVGNSFETDISTIQAIISDLGLKNVDYLGIVNQNQLKYLIQNSHIGIVNYGQYDLNNKYCASGKLYEFIYEGVPVVTTTNPPLVDICTKYSVGIADDNFFSAIDTILDNYDYYVGNALSFAESNTVEENNCRLTTALKDLLTDNMK